MKVTISLLVAFFAIAAAAAATTDDQKSSYEGYKLVRVFPTSQEQVDFVHDLEEKENVDIWGAVLTGDEKTIDVMLSPSQFSKYSRMFASRHIRFQLLVENVQELIDNEAKSMEKSRADRNSIIFRYARYNEMMNFIEETVEQNSDIATSEIIGRTEQNRALHLIRLRSGNPSKAVWIDCGIHAREWVSPSTCIYIIYALIDEFRDFNPVIMDLFAKYEFYILPSVNPDGYEFSQTTTRLWRKNRKVNAGSSCLGVDLNRNFPFMWMSGGASSSPCSDTYAGPSASSEPETKAITNFVSARAGQFDSFLSIHSYGNWWLTPYGHSTTEIAPDQDLIMAAATVGVDAIRAYNGSIFVAGPSSQLLYIHSGLSPDWAYASENIRYSHVIELRPGPNTPDYIYGFMLPEDRMPLVATETYVGIKAFLHYISKL